MFGVESPQGWTCTHQLCPGIVRHAPGKATLSSCPAALRFQRWESDPSQGLITIGVKMLPFGASKQESPSQLLN
jgi:hypothetical protein